MYKASIVPLSGGRRLEEVDGEKAADWLRVLEGLRDFLRQSFSLADSWGGLPADETQQYELACDLITLFFKLPLLREPLLSVAPNPLKAYLILRLHPDLRRESFRAPIEFAELVYQRQVHESFQKKLNKLLSEREIADAVRKCWLTLPSDTRPGASTAGLIPHLLTTSALAWSLSVQKGKVRQVAAEVRLVALFHDMGKPFDYKLHYEEGAKVVGHVLADVEPLSRRVAELKELVRHHHKEKKTELAEILSGADSLASASDRLNKLCQTLILPSIRECAARLQLNVEDAYRGGEPSWEFWRRFANGCPGEFRRISEDFAARLAGLQGDEELKRLTKGGRDESSVRFCLIDVGGIQDFISRSRELRCLTAASLLVDITTTAYLPLRLQTQLEARAGCWLPLEAFLYTAGGMVNFILPASVAEELRQLWDEIKRDCAQNHIYLYLADTAYHTSYYEASGRLASQMALRKLKDEPALPITPFGGKRGHPQLCKSCYLEPPKADSQKGFCELCERLYELGSELHFRARWDAQLTDVAITADAGIEPKPSEVFGIPWEKAAELDLMYLLAGHTAEEAQGRPERKRNLAVVKVDGNLMGFFMAGSVSVSDAMERSARVDLALKDALERAFQNVAEALRPRNGREALQAVLACRLGLLYMGGDDALLICPSWLSLPLAAQLGEYFNEELGGAASLSVGVAAAPPEHDVWALIEAASELLEKAKKVGRRLEAKGAACFDVVESGLLSAMAVRARNHEVKLRGLSAQPFSLSGMRGYFSLRELFEWMGMGDGGGKVYDSAFEASREEDNETKKRLKMLRKVLREALARGEERAEGRYGLMISLVLARRPRNGSEESRQAWESVAGLLQRWLIKRYENPDGGVGFPAADADRAIKLVGGGLI